MGGFSVVLASLYCHVCSLMSLKEKYAVSCLLVQFYLWSCCMIKTRANVSMWTFKCQVFDLRFWPGNHYGKYTIWNMNYFYAHTERNWKVDIREYCHMLGRHLFVNSNYEDSAKKHAFYAPSFALCNFSKSIHISVSLKYHFKHFFR